MKISLDKEKTVEVFSNLIQKTSDLSKKTLSGVQAGATALTEKTKQESYLRRLKKYNPLFPDAFFSEEFNVPNMIMIRDDAERRGIDVCEGAIGWLGKEGTMEVLYLYDEAVQNSGFSFVPTADCDAVYYVDSFDRKKFIRIDYIFSKAHEERLAELKHVAHFLGAKKCSIEISESNVELNVSKKRMAVSGSVQVRDERASTQERAERDSSAKNTAQRSGKICIEFEGSNTPQKPTLKWFTYDENVNKLIDMRMRGDNSIKSETLHLSGSSTLTMSQKTAYAIDNAMGSMKAKGSASMESQAVRESRSTLIFNIEF